MTRSEKENRIRQTASSPSEKQDNKTPAGFSQNRLTLANGAPAWPMNERTFDMVVDGVPYSVRSVPFLFNNEPRFKVCINGGTEHLLAWDSQSNILRAIDEESSKLPSVVEEALSERLQKP